MGIQEVKRGYRGLQGVTRRLQGVKEVTMGYRELQMVTRGYKG